MGAVEIHRRQHRYHKALPEVLLQELNQVAVGAVEVGLHLLLMEHLDLQEHLRQQYTQVALVAVVIKAQSVVQPLITLAVAVAVAELLLPQLLEALVVVALVVKKEFQQQSQDQLILAVVVAADQAQTAQEAQAAPVS